MKVEIVKKSENPLLKRTELEFTVDHAGSATPKRLEVRAQLASLLQLPEDVLVIDTLKSTHGLQKAFGRARTYGSREQLEALESKYLLERGVPKKPKEEKPDEKAPEKPKEAKPAEKKPEKAKEEKPVEKKAKEKPAGEDKGGKGS